MVPAEGKRVRLHERVFSGPESLNWCSWAGKHGPEVAWPHHCGSEPKYIRLACGSYCTHRASVGLAMLLFCLPGVILYDIHFFCCLMCSYLIMSCFCPSCLLFKYRYSLTKSRWLELKGLILPIMILFYSGSSFLSVSGSVLSLASSVNFHAKYS